MTKRGSIISCVLTVLLIVYLVFALTGTATMARDEHVPGVLISGAGSGEQAFVTDADIRRDCADLIGDVSRKRHADIDIYAIERRLTASDRIEAAQVYFLNDGTLAIDVQPMVPVARVFDDNKSYYINAQGKHISADARYHVDVPVVVGHFSHKYQPQRLLPLLSYISHDDNVNALISTVKQTAGGDIILVPCIRGHVINFGDTAATADKFDRLVTFYREVMPVKGWTYYDTISVKWGGRIVATRRNKELENIALNAVFEDFDESDDFETISAGEYNDSINAANKNPRPTGATATTTD